MGRVWRVPQLLASVLIGVWLCACGRIGFDALRGAGDRDTGSAMPDGGGGAGGSGGTSGAGGSSGAGGAGGGDDAGVSMDASTDAVVGVDGSASDATAQDAQTDALAGDAQAADAEADGARDGGADSGVDASTDAGTDTGADAGGCSSALTGEAEFERRMQLAFPPDTNDWMPSTAACDGSACNGYNLVCTAGNTCSLRAIGGAAPNSGRCEDGAVCRVLGIGTGLDFVNPMVCEAGSTCYISAYNGTLRGPVTCRAGSTCSVVGEFGVLDGVTCEAGARCAFNCTNGMCHNVVIEDGGTVLLNCAIGYCATNCSSTTRCIADCRGSGPSSCPTCASDAECACFGDLPANGCANMCSGPPPCTTPSATSLLTECWAF